MESDYVELPYDRYRIWVKEYRINNGFDDDRISCAELVFDRSNYVNTCIDTLTFKIIDKQKYLLAKIEYDI